MGGGGHFEKGKPWRKTIDVWSHAHQPKTVGRLNSSSGLHNEDLVFGCKITPGIHCARKVHLRSQLNGFTEIAALDDNRNGFTTESSQTHRDLKLSSWAHVDLD